NLLEQGRDYPTFKEPLRPNERLTWPVVIGSLPFTSRDDECPPGSRELVMGYGVSTLSSACVKVPGSAMSWQNRTGGGVPLEFDTWMPLLVGIPIITTTATIGDGPGANTTYADAEPDDWLVLSAYM